MWWWFSRCENQRRAERRNGVARRGIRRIGASCAYPRWLGHEYSTPFGFTAHEDVRPTGRVPVTTGSVSNWDRAVLFQGVRRMRRAEREGLRVLPHRLNVLPNHLRMLPGRLRALPLRLNGIRECLRTVPAGLSGVHPRWKGRPMRVAAQRLRNEPIRVNSTWQQRILLSFEF